jgi:catechol 2,3-dioxygenase-like lactoylglutathione lyase family enzyme
MQPRLDHIQITVKDFAAAEAFYDKLMPILGFDLAKKHKGRVAAHDFDVIEYVHHNMVLGINSPREVFKDEAVHRRKPGALHHLAFRASSREEVDDVYAQIRNIGASWIAEPQFYPQHGASYYALFFKDPGGIKLEVMIEER